MLSRTRPWEFCCSQAFAVNGLSTPSPTHRNRNMCETLWSKKLLFGQKASLCHGGKLRKCQSNQRTQKIAVDCNTPLQKDANFAMENHDRRGCMQMRFSTTSILKRDYEVQLDMDSTVTHTFVGKRTVKHRQAPRTRAILCQIRQKNMEKDSLLAVTHQC